ncbi:MAG: DUF1772 domain-containing protein [Burkholderiales bacterium]
MKQLDLTYFLSILFVALTLAPSAAHLLELSNKISLSADDYLTVQQIYRGWALLGVVILGAVLSTAAHLTVLRLHRQPWLLAAVGLACLLAGQAVFWTFTFPANQETGNWTMLPENWTHLREQWEYSHAAGALLNLSAFVVLLWAALRRGGGPSRHS